MEGKKTLDELLAEPDDPAPIVVFESEDDRKARWRNYYRRYWEKKKRENIELVRQKWRDAKKKKREVEQNARRTVLLQHGEGAKALSGPQGP